jgi:hypothetical protein
MSDNVVSLRRESIRSDNEEPWIDTAEMLENLAQRVRAGEVKGVGVALVEMEADLPQVVANWSFASGHRYNLSVATALLEYRFANTSSNPRATSGGGSGSERLEAAPSRNMAHRGALTAHRQRTG